MYVCNTRLHCWMSAQDPWASNKDNKDYSAIHFLWSCLVQIITDVSLVLEFGMDCKFHNLLGMWEGGLSSSPPLSCGKPPSKAASSTSSRRPAKVKFSSFCKAEWQKLTDSCPCLLTEQSYRINSPALTLTSSKCVNWIIHLRRRILSTESKFLHLHSLLPLGL